MLRPTSDKSRTRPPAVAGLFYPADANDLRSVVADCIDRAVLPPAGLRRAPKALIVPHAGYPYSGPVAGFAWRLLRDSAATIRHVVLIGPSHRVPLRGLAVPSVATFTTPLGEVRVDQTACQRLVQQGLAVVSDAAHAHEHSLEVQLPFLQVLLGDQFDLLPVVFGAATTAQVEQVCEAAWGSDDTLVVVSSDLSHYLPFDEAKAVDAATTQAIVAGEDDIDDEQACGARAINGLRRLASKRSLAIELLDQRNSGETAGDRSRVVGYASYALHAA